MAYHRTEIMHVRSSAGRPVVYLTLKSTNRLFCNVVGATVTLQCAVCFEVITVVPVFCQGHLLVKTMIWIGFSWEVLDQAHLYMLVKA